MGAVIKLILALVNNRKFIGLLHRGSGFLRNNQVITYTRVENIEKINFIDLYNMLKISSYCLISNNKIRSMSYNIPLKLNGFVESAMKRR